MRKRGWVGIGIAAVALAGGAAAFAQYRNIEQPRYESVMQEGAFELRDYPELVVAEVTHDGARGGAMNNGFRRLAAYIFAKDRPGAKGSANGSANGSADPSQSEEIAMTSPVMVSQSEPIAMTSPVMLDEQSEGAWRTRFVMPSKYTLETLPDAPDDITLTVMPGRQMAAVRFSGRGGNRDLMIAEDALRTWMEARDLTASGPAEYAFYDAPMVPPQLRRNEVMIPVARPSAEE